MEIFLKSLIDRILEPGSIINEFSSSIIWMIPDGSFIDKDKPICSLKLRYSNPKRGWFTRLKEYEVKSPVSGYLNIQYNYMDSWTEMNHLSLPILSETLLCTIEDKDNLIFCEKYSDFFKYKIEKDEFTQQNVIVWTDIFRKHWKLRTGIILELKRVGEDDCLIIRTKERYDIGTKISFLFTDNSIISFAINDKPKKFKDANAQYMVKFALFENELVMFATQFVKNCKIQFPDGDYMMVPSFPMPDVFSLSPAFDAQMFFCLWFKTYMKAAKEAFPNWQPKQVVDSEIDKNKNTTDIHKKDNVFVYLMIDHNTGYHKIGISNNPSYREQTLQSEKPTIEMLCCKSFPNRRIAQSIESALHSLYSTKRIRGEWFDLDEQDLSDLKDTLQ